MSKWLTALGPVIEDRARELNNECGCYLRLDKCLWPGQCDNDKERYKSEKYMSDRLRIRDGLRGRRRVIEISPTTYKEIWNKLIEAGYDWLVWPDLGQIPMDGFVIRSVDRGK